MFEPSPISCGVAQIFGWSVNVVENLKEFYRAMQPGGKLGYRAIAVWSSPLPDEYRRKYGSTPWSVALLDLIKANDLGQVDMSTPVTNERYGKKGSTIAVWIWVINHANLKVWYDKQVAVRPTTTTPTVQGGAFMPVGTG